MESLPLTCVDLSPSQDTLGTVSLIPFLRGEPRQKNPTDASLHEVSKPILLTIYELQVSPAQIRFSLEKTPSSLKARRIEGVSHFQVYFFPLSHSDNSSGVVKHCQAQDRNRGNC